MKTLFIPAYSKSQIKISKEIFKKLPKNLAIFYSIQFKTQAKKIQNLLEKTKKITQFSQILGCSKPKIPKQTHAVILVGSGKFHALAISKNSKLPIFIFSNNKLTPLNKDEISKIQKKQKAAYLNFLHAEKIGVLISTKPGQENLKVLNSKFKKKTYFFLSNNIDTSEFENFGIKSWVNTACPRLSEDNSKIINLQDLKH